MNKVLEVKYKTSRDNVTSLLFAGEAKLSEALGKRQKEDKAKESEVKSPQIYSKKSKCPCEIFENDKEQVLKLRDDISVTSERSNFTERFLENRRSNHEAVIDKLFIDLEYLGRETKEGVEFVSRHLIKNLNDNYKDIELAMESLKCKEIFQSEQDVKNLWILIDEKYDENIIWIQEFCLTLCKQENLKMIKVQELLKNCYAKLRAIAYLNPDEIYDQLFDYAMELQKTSLNNRNRFSDLQWTLTINDETSKMKQFAKWNQFWQNWLQNLTTSAIEQFTLVLPAIASGNYGFIRHVINKFNNECDIVVTKRVKLLFNIRNIKPPTCKESAQKWIKSFLNLNEEHEILCHNFGHKITLQHPQLLNELNDEILSVKKSLLRREICSQSIIDGILNEKQLNAMNDHLLDLNLTIESVKREKEYQRDGLDALEAITINAVTDVIGLWEKHESQLSLSMKSIEDELADICQRMSEKCDYEEKRLTIFLDNMREENSKEGLEKCLSLAMESLNNIKSCYRNYQKKRVEMIKSLPALVSGEVNKYRSDLREYFGPASGYLLNPVSSKLKEIMIKVTSESKTGQTYSDLTETTDKEQTEKSKDQVEKLKDRQKSWHSVELAQYYLPSYITGTYSSIDLQSFMAVTLPNQSFSADQFKKFPSGDTTWIGCETYFQHLLRILCVNFAAHWEQWLLQSIRQADSVKEIKLIELKNELELRLQLHASRIERIKCDIFDLRLKELYSHFEQVNRHVMALGKDIDALSTKIEAFKNGQIEYITMLRNKINKMEEQMMHLSTASGVIDHRNKMETTVIEEVHKHKEIISKFQDEIDSTIAAFHDSNINLTKTFKSFFNNGNYSNDEIISLNSQIMKLGPSLQSVEFFAGKTLGDLQVSWSNENEALKKMIAINWDNAEVDMEFIERINRSFSNVQVKIKCEVKANNTLSFNLGKNIDRLIDLLDKDADEAIYVYFRIVQELALRAVKLGIVTSVDVGPHVAPKTGTAVSKDKKGSSFSSYVKIPIELQLFGSEQPENETDFLGIIKTLLWKLQNDLFVIAENFYHKRSDRILRFPHLIPVNFDNCCKDVTTKIRNYWNQTKDYHSQSTKELFDQVERTNSVTIRFIPFLTSALKKRYLSYLHDRSALLRIYINKFFDEWNAKKSNLTTRLRPQLGFPTQTTKLQQLLDDVRDETESFITQWAQYYKDLRNVVKETGLGFVEVLNEIVENLMKKMEHLVTEKELIYVKAGLDVFKLRHVESVAESSIIRDYKSVGIWPEFSDRVGNDEIKLTDAFAIKNNFAQECLLDFRDKVYNEFGDELMNVLEELENENEKRVCGASQWRENFLLSVSNLKEIVENA